MIKICEQKFCEMAGQKLWTKIVSKSYKNHHWHKFRTELVNQIFEQEFWNRIVNKSCEQKFWTKAEKKSCEWKLKKKLA